MDDKVVICRCEDITLGDIRQRIINGERTVDELKRSLRIGMGPCQGRTCIPLVVQEIAKLTGKPIEEIELTTFRPPAAPIKLGTLAGGKADD